MFGKNLESANKAWHYRESRRLQDAAEEAAGVANSLTVGSSEWKEAVAMVKGAMEAFDAHMMKAELIG
jgi:hypothetical protein